MLQEKFFTHKVLTCIIRKQCERLYRESLKIVNEKIPVLMSKDPRRQVRKRLEERKKIAILGAGSIGCSFASLSLSKGHEVLLHPTPFDKEIVQMMRDKKPHPVLGISFSEAIETGQLKISYDELAIKDSTLICIGVSSTGILWSIGVLERIFAQVCVPVLLLTKGLKIEEERLSFFYEGIEKRGFSVVVAAGPCIARELAQHRLTHVVFAGEKAEICRKIFETAFFSVDVSDDLAGVSLCAALKNIYAIGISAALGTGGKGTDGGALVCWH